MTYQMASALCRPFILSAVLNLLVRIGEIRIELLLNRLVSGQVIRHPLERPRNMEEEGWKSVGRILQELRV